MGAIAVGLALLAAAWLNWRYIERLTAAMWGGGEGGQRFARRLAEPPWGNRIGGTVVLAAFGVVLVVGGIVKLM
jgi:hypothetical protein